jgi:predicted Fe-S protein YdhL (DUF1289 family)
VIDTASGLCQGCGRTLDEIAGWAAMDGSARERICAALDERMRRVFGDDQPSRAAP